MDTHDERADALTAEESWQTIHTTVDDARNSMYLAGSTAIMLLWGVIVSVGYFSHYAIETFATEFAENRQGYPGLLWGGLALVGGVSSGIIGHRAGSTMATSGAVRRAGIRVACFWSSVVGAALFLTAVAGSWNPENAETSPRIFVGVIALGYVLFGIMHRPVISVLGLGYAAAFYIPEYLLGDAALAVSGMAMVAMTAAGFVWVFRNREW